LIVAKNRGADKHLFEALTRAYTARARLFHNGVIASNIDLLIAEIDSVQEPGEWNLGKLGITVTAFARLKKSGGSPRQVFAHPDIIKVRPHLIAYYRNMATVSQKGIGQILFPTTRYESRRAPTVEDRPARQLCRTLNAIISGVIDGMPNYNVAVSRKAIFAELGAQFQGTWVNLVGQGAAKAVQNVLRVYIQQKELGSDLGTGKYALNNGWRIEFAAEPDVAFFDSRDVKQIAIEIKGSLDMAGAQTRYGEAGKTFQKQLDENPRCHTIYLASCFTDAVIDQIRRDGKVREWFNLTSIIYDEDERDRFLRRLFHVVNTPR
jgi:hypothetical protein